MATMTEQVVTAQSGADHALTPSYPWRDWVLPQERNLDLGRCRVGAVPTEDGSLLFRLLDGERSMGLLTDQALDQIASKVRFPVDFLGKVQQATAVQIVNDRLQMNAQGLRMTAMSLGENIIGLTPTRGRWMVPIADYFDAALEAAATTGYEEGVAPPIHHLTPFDRYQKQGRAVLEIALPKVNDTVRVGDTVRAGIRCSYDHGGHLGVSILVERLICLNGMTAKRITNNWRDEESNSLDGQLQWVRRTIQEASGEFEAQMNAYRRLAERPIDEFTTIDEVVRARGREFSLSRADEIAVVHAWNNPLGEERRERTEWDLLNAVTQAVTHDERFAERREELQLQAGEWASNSGLVTARLRRTLATRIGAEIIPD